MTQKSSVIVTENNSVIMIRSVTETENDSAITIRSVIAKYM